MCVGSDMAEWAEYSRSRGPATQIWKLGFAGKRLELSVNSKQNDGKGQWDYNLKSDLKELADGS